jgi:hypothetical protein
MRIIGGTLGLADALTLLDGDWLRLGEAETDVDGLCDGLCDLLTLDDGVADAEADGLADRDRSKSIGTNHETNE